jgi:cardiolipin synthase
MVVDAVWATVGTTNFDNRSFAHNEENNVCVFDAALACALQETFLADLAGCDRVNLREWRRRGLIERVGEFIAAFLQEQT